MSDFQRKSQQYQNKVGDIRINDDSGNDIRIVYAPRGGDNDHSIGAFPHILINGEEFLLKDIVSALDSAYVCPPDFKRG